MYRFLLRDGPEAGWIPQILYLLNLLAPLQFGDLPVAELLGPVGFADVIDALVVLLVLLDSLLVEPLDVVLIVGTIEPLPRNHRQASEGEETSEVAVVFESRTLPILSHVCAPFELQDKHRENAALLLETLLA